MKERRWMCIPYGVIVGATMMVPGVSGGSMAMILGIYDRLITAISSFRKNPKDNFLFLVTFALSGAVGMFLFSAPLSWLMEHFPASTMYFFLGSVFGGIPMICKKAQSQIWAANSIIYVMIGILGALLFTLIPVDLVSAQNNNGLKYQAMLVLLGAPTASALVLPGISVSHFLLVLGLYENLIEAIKNFELAFLIPLGSGIFLGVIVITKGLEFVLNHYPKASYLIILGFVLGSVVEIFPGIPTGMSLVMCLAGFFIVYMLGKISFIKT